jgi:hypothetical protein
VKIFCRAARLQNYLELQQTRAGDEPTSVWRCSRFTARGDRDFTLGTAGA